MVGNGETVLKVGLMATKKGRSMNPRKNTGLNLYGGSNLPMFIMYYRKKNKKGTVQED